MFLALSRRTDTVLEQLKEIWPPPLRPDAGSGDEWLAVCVFVGACVRALVRVRVFACMYVCIYVCM